MTHLVAFFQTHGYVLELMICNLIFSYSQKKRSFYSGRLAICALVMITSSLILNQLHTASVLYNLFKYVVWYAISIVSCMFVYRLNRKVAMFISMGAFISQHMSFKVGEIIQFYLGAQVTPLLSNALYVLTVALMYVLCFFAFARRFKQLNVRNAKQNQLFLLYFAVAIYVTVLQYIFEGYIDHMPEQLYLIYASFDLICCAFAMMLQFGIIETSSLKEESKLMQHVLYMQNEKYRMSKENIDLINIKFHDLKKQLAVLTTLDSEEIQKLYQALNIYDMSIKSGNEALDIILAEKSLLCEQQQIRLECIADGEMLSFMSPSDIYSLIGNAIDNAIESVLKVKEKGRRFITISIRKTRDLLIIHIENPFDGELSFRDGLPRTTKPDTAYHGYGMKSIQMVVEKYHGYFSIRSENQLFVLNVVFTKKSESYGKS